MDQEDTLEDSTDTSVEETQTKVDDVAEEPSVDEERLRRTCRTEAREDVLRRNPNRAVRFLELLDRKSTRLNSSHSGESRMPSSA